MEMKKIRKYIEEHGKEHIEKIKEENRQKLRDTMGGKDEKEIEIERIDN